MREVGEFFEERLTRLAACGVAPEHVALDPGIDLRRTTYLSRMIQRWGKLPIMLLNGMELKSHRYAYIGSEDWSMYPLIQPGSLVVIDETRRKIVNSGWSHESERPIYFLEHRDEVLDLRLDGGAVEHGLALGQHGAQQHLFGGAHAGEREAQLAADEPIGSEVQAVLTVLGDRHHGAPRRADES